MHHARPDLGPFIFVTLAVLLGLYFTFASIQGDFGLFQRLVIEAEARDLLAERDRLRSEITGLANRTHRMSDDYLDLDMLDEQARSVLGLVRADEIVIP